MKIKVDVTAADIRKGEIGSADTCPVARAIKRLGFKEYVSVTSGEIQATGKTRVINVYTPKRVANFIRKFDDLDDVKDETAARKALKPFSFTVTAQARTAQNDPNPDNDFDYQD